MSFAEINKGLARFKAPQGRQMFHQIKGVTVIDDTYNANPVSFKNAVRTLAIMKNGGRAILIGADMLELGETSEKLHREVGAYAAANGVNRLMTCGRFARFISDEAKKMDRSMETYHFEQQEKVFEALVTDLRRGDVVLAKGSRGMKMERLVESLLEHLKNQK